MELRIIIICSLMFIAGSFSSSPPGMLSEKKIPVLDDQL